MSLKKIYVYDCGSMSEEKAKEVMVKYGLINVEVHGEQEEHGVCVVTQTAYTIMQRVIIIIHVDDSVYLPSTFIND